MLASYQATYAASLGRSARDIFREWGPAVFGHALNPAITSSSEWGVAGYAGLMRTSGAGGSMTGKGADYLIVDDPIKNSQEAMSATIRDGLWDWWQSTAYSRLEPGGVAIVIQTRWHEDDLAGRLIKEMRTGGERWEVISMPAIAEEDETWTFGDWSWSRKQGDALWPERYPVAALERIRRQVGTYWWSALYQQRPQPAGGGIFKREWFRYFTVEGDYYVLKTSRGDKRIPKDVVTRFVTVDPAASLKTTADYTAIGHWGLTPDGELLLLDVVRERIEGPEQVTLLRSLYDRWQPGFIGVEAVAYQLTLFQHLLRQGLPVRKLKVDADKVSRALVYAARMEAGMVYLRASAKWLDEYENEHLMFPRGEHDDTVDIGSAAAQESVGLREPTVRSL